MGQASGTGPQLALCLRAHMGCLMPNPAYDEGTSGGADSGAGATRRRNFVDAGGYHTCAIDRVSGDATTGNLWCWGSNHDGQRAGPVGLDMRLEPNLVDEVGLVKQVAASRRHTCVITAESELWCWGGNAAGELGIGTISDSPRLSFVDIPGTPKQVCAGSGYSCALTTDGAVYCWGDNRFGQVGPGCAASSCPAPVLVDDPDLPVDGPSLIACDEEHICGLAAGGTEIWCWGDNRAGEVQAATLSQRQRIIRASPRAVASTARATTATGSPPPGSTRVPIHREPGVR